MGSGGVHIVIFWVEALQIRLIRLEWLLFSEIYWRTLICHTHK